MKHHCLYWVLAYIFCSHKMHPSKTKFGSSSSYVGCFIFIQFYLIGNKNIASRPMTRPTCTLCHMACMWPLLHVLNTIEWTSFFIWQMRTSYRRTGGKCKILTHNPMRKDNAIQSEHIILHYVQCYIVVQRLRSLYLSWCCLNDNYFHWNPSSNTPTSSIWVVFILVGFSSLILPQIELTLSSHLNL